MNVASDLPVPDRDRMVADLGLPGWSPWLGRAMCHRSWCAENGSVPSNERLEFLGDSVLGFVVADRVFRAATEVDEGVLTDVRKAVVNAVALADVADDVDLGRHLLLGKGEEASGGREKPSILADAVEAVIGATYLEWGLDAAYELIDRVLGERLGAAIEGKGRGQDHKSRLQETLPPERGQPVYTFVASGPDHAREFEASVSVDGEVLGVGNGRSKKQAEQQAARAALVVIDEHGVDGPNDPGGDPGA